MGLFRKAPPNLPMAPAVFDRVYLDQLTNVLRLYFAEINAVQTIGIAGANIDIGRLPTEAALTTLRSGDVYRDTTAGNVLKVKP